MYMYMYMVDGAEICHWPGFLIPGGQILEIGLDAKGSDLDKNREVWVYFFITVRVPCLDPGDPHHPPSYLPRLSTDPRAARVVVQSMSAPWMASPAT